MWKASLFPGMMRLSGVKWRWKILLTWAHNDDAGMSEGKIRKLWKFFKSILSGGVEVSFTGSMTGGGRHEYESRGCWGCSWVERLSDTRLWKWRMNLSAENGKKVNFNFFTLCCCCMRFNDFFTPRAQTVSRTIKINKIFIIFSSFLHAAPASTTTLWANLQTSKLFGEKRLECETTSVVGCGKVNNLRDFIVWDD